MAVDQSWGHTGVLRINRFVGVLGVAVGQTAHGGDETILDHDGVAAEDGRIDVAREQQPNVANDHLA